MFLNLKKYNNKVAYTCISKVFFNATSSINRAFYSTCIIVNAFICYYSFVYRHRGNPGKNSPQWMCPCLSYKQLTCGDPSEETAKTEAISQQMWHDKDLGHSLHKGCICAEHRPNFCNPHSWQLWRLHVDEIFSSMTQNNI